MPWQPGRSGNPGGRPQDKPFTDALRLAAFTEIKSGEHKGSTKLRRIAEVVVEQAVKGVPWAVHMVADRLDGKPMQQTESKIETDSSQLFLEVLRRMQPSPESKTIDAEVDQLRLTRVFRERAFR